MNWLHYLLEANIYLGVFYSLYFVLLKNETYYKLNRAYLLATCVVAYIIPVVQVSALRPVYRGAQTVTIILNNQFRPNAVAYPLTLQDFVLYTYAIGVFIMLGIFVFKLIQLLKLTRTQKSLLYDKYKVVTLQESNIAFSFFNYVFIGSKVSGTETIIRHEIVHIDQMHSLDIVFLELIKIISWFNPLTYMILRSLKAVHEYIADEQTAAYQNDVLSYSSFLVNNAYGVSGSSIAHSFFNYNLLKKRIIMLNQKRSGNLTRLKYLLVIPLCAGLLCASTLGFSKTYVWVDLSQIKVSDTIKNLKLIPIKTSANAENINEESHQVKQNQKLATLKLTVQSKLSGRSKAPQEITIDTPAKTTTIPIKLEIAAARANAEEVHQKMPPPMAPFLSPSKEFYEMSMYVAKHVRYPAVAFENKLVGSVIVKFDIAENHKLSNVIFIKGIGSGCDEEVLRVIKGYTGDVNTKQGTYKLAVTFNLDGINPPNSASETLANDPSFAGEVVVEGYPSK